jgi:(E)-2-((N-methylformamido)methylene)succinate hydrolase
LRQYADQLLALLDHLQISCVHLVGHSMGALVGLEFALSHPQHTRSVVAMNAVFCRTPEQRAAVRERAAAFERGLQADWDGTITRWFGDPIPDASAAAASTMRELLNAVDPTGYARTYRLFATADTAHRERLASLQVPALFVTGENDPNSTPAMSHAMATLAPRGRALVIAGERHMMSLTAAAHINRVLIDFLRGAGRDAEPDAGGAGAGSRAHVDHERSEDTVGIYMGASEQGTVQMNTPSTTPRKWGNPP